MRLALSPNLNAFHWDDVERSAAQILDHFGDARAPAVLIDLSKLDYLGSAQLTLLVRVWKAVKSRNGSMVVHVTTPVVREVLNTAGLQSLWILAETPGAAFRALGLQEDGRRRMSMAWTLVGLVALAGALAGLFGTLLKSNVLDGKTVLVAQLICSAVALAAGLWTVVRGSGARRGLGIGMVVASALLAVVGVLNHPR
jgi:anti-anti-sigma factor